MALVASGVATAVFAGASAASRKPHTTSTTTTVPPPAGARPYDPSSPWNTPIGSSPTVSPSSAAWMASIASTGPFSSDPDQYTIPVYCVDASTPLRTVALNGYYSTY